MAPNKKPEKSDKKRKALEDAAEGLKAAKDRVSFWIFNPAPLWYRQAHNFWETGLTVSARAIGGEQRFSNVFKML